LRLMLSFIIFINLHAQDIVVAIKNINYKEKVTSDKVTFSL